MVTYENWKKALENCHVRHDKLHSDLAIAAIGDGGTIRIAIGQLEQTIEELETKIRNHETEHGLVPQNPHSSSEIAPKIKSGVNILQQNLNAFADLESLQTADLKNGADLSSTYNKLRNDLAGLFVVASGEKIMDSAELRKNYINSTLFDKIASGTLLGIADKHDLDTLFNETDNHSYYYRSIIASALTLGLMHTYDAQKVILLINIINQGEPWVWKRALVGLVIGLNGKDHELSEDIVRRLAGLKEKPSVQKEFINLAEAFESLEEEMIQIQGFSGAVRLQDCFEFFDTPAHWFLPFYPQNDVIKETKALREPLKTLLVESGSWCIDAFKYAYCKRFNTFSEELHPLIVDLLKKEKKEITDSYPEELENNYPSTMPMTALRFTNETKAYLQCICFFTQNSPKEKFKTLFNSTHSFYQSPLSHFVLSNNTYLEIKALKFFNQGNEQENPEQAIVCYKEAVKYKPDYHEAWYNMGVDYWKQENPEQAIVCYKETVKYKPDYHEAWMGMGVAYMNQKNYKEAIVCYKEAIKHKPNEHEALMGMGEAYRIQENYEEAIACYREAVKYKPNFHEALNNMGTSFRKQENLEQAIACYEEAIKHKPDCHEAWYYMGYTYGLQQNHEQAIFCYKKAVKHKTDYRDAWMNLGFGSIIIGELSKAKKHTLAAIEHGSLNYGNMNLAHICLCEKNDNLAIETYLIAITHFDDKHEFWTGYEDDYQYLSQYGLDYDHYQHIKQVLQNRLDL